MLKKYGALVIIGALLAGAVCLKLIGDKVLPTTTPQAAATNADAVVLAEESPEAAPRDYFADFRGEREAVRERELQYLDEIIATSSVDAETLEEAVEQKLALVENMESEFTMESMITAKGFKDAAVTFRNGTVNVVVDAQALSSEEVAQILDIVQRETGVKASDVRVTNNDT